ncbi:Ldh family oxidoreductase [Sulfitobacter sp. HNIBRBA3233]|uniref:Ldh family oxidoreductase n=1 Tax=Sulfitobacter marinivivus TaxID=3158558 RepID=UPI0032DEA36E
MPRISLDTIEKTVRRALRAHGADEFPAAEVARAVRQAEGLGNKICGLYYVESYCQQLLSGRVDGTVSPDVRTVRPAAVQVDAGFGFAQPAFAHGLPVALDAARQYGVSTLAVMHAHTCTALGYFTEQIAASGMIGIGFTNATPIVAPPGGKTRMIGTNPMAFAVPDGRGGLAMQFDQSTTTVALGKITMAQAAGEAIPEGWALDARGNPTTNPASALKGSLVSVGGHKGWGLGLMVEVLAAAMTGSLMSHDVKPLKAPEGAPHDLGQYYLIIDPAVQPDFRERMEALASLVAQDAGARLPGRNRTLCDPVEVAEDVWRTILALSER